MNLRVLILEDDLPSLELMHDVLTSEGAEVVATADTAKAAELIRSRRFDGIFLDLRMPGLNGFQLTEVVRESKRNAITPVIIVSGEDAPAMPAAFESGAMFYLAKPVDRSKVLRLFRTAQGGITFNRTRSIRVPLVTAVTCVKGTQVFRGPSRNISMGGLLFDGHQDLQPGDQVQISFTLPGSVRPITAPAFIVRTDVGGQVGVGFSSLSGEDRLRIRELVATSAA